MNELLEHNKETYKRLCDVLENNNKCALVQATGTGKSYIAGKYIEEYSNTALILVPTNAIADAWEELLAGAGKEIDIITYQAFTREPQSYLDYDLVIADEMHHLGSDVWGKRFVETYLQSENHKIIGLTATEIRYLDNSRDMAEEIFGNIRVDGCDLPTAINTGVLPIFKYVSALYCDESDFDEWKEKAGKIKDIKTQTELKGRLDVCIKNMVSVKQAVNENLTDDYKKIIVFLNNVESKETALEMFRDVFLTANFYDVDYSKSRTENNSQISRFKADNNRSVLFAVDMLNEGIHIKGTDCVIMFRKTVSPQVYFQQLGRGLASGTDKMPVIFDFVSNVNNIKTKEKAEETSPKNFIQKVNEKILNEKKILVKTYSDEAERIICEISKFRKNRWTQEEDEYLKENFKDFSREELGEKLGRNSNSVLKRLQFLGLTKTPRKMTYEEKEYIKENYGKIKTCDISKKLKTTPIAINQFASRNGISKKRSGHWGEEEKEYLKNNYKEMTVKELSEKSGKSERSILDWVRKLKLSRKRKYSYEEDNFIKENIGVLTANEIAEKLNRSTYSVYNRVRFLGITKKHKIQIKMIAEQKEGEA